MGPCSASSPSSSGGSQPSFHREWCELPLVPPSDLNLGSCPFFWGQTGAGSPSTDAITARRSPNAPGQGPCSPGHCCVIREQAGGLAGVSTKLSPRLLGPMSTRPCQQHIPNHMGQLSPPGSSGGLTSRGSDRKGRLATSCRGHQGSPRWEAICGTAVQPCRKLRRPDLQEE